MVIQLLICPLTLSEPSAHEIEFFTSEKEDAEAEKQLMHYLREAVSLLRNTRRGLHVALRVAVDDPVQVNNFISKHLRCRSSIVNNQKLSKRECQVLNLIREGFTNKEISDKLFISFETVKSHRKNILVKTGASNTAALVSFSHQVTL